MRPGSRRGPADVGTAWQPGLESSIPGSLMPLVTLYRPEHAYRPYSECRELAAFTGLQVLDLVALRPERLVVHELLLRVTADLSVPDGADYGVLGLNLRGMVQTILTRHVQAELPTIVQAFEDERRRAVTFIEAQLNEHIYRREPAASVSAPASFWSRLFARPGSTAAGGPRGRGGGSAGSTAGDGSDAQGGTSVEVRALDYWKSCMSTSGDPLQQCCHEALIKTVGTITGHRGRLVVDCEMLTRITADMACQQLGTDLVRALIDPLFETAVKAEGYLFLPAQAKPVIMNVKGASASGKSTIRPRQRHLAAKLGIPWADFALISPDYWRKYLLDYTSLGDDYKYGAMLTGQELAIIDRKLDHYMATKASCGTMSHLLIDRFRFDSFTLEKGRSADSRLLTRFGDRVYLFFMITPPSETVERAWKRGLTTGRYKAVDDLLFHNIEAYEGMPALFLSWITAVDKQIHVEFLDNDVPEGQPPQTAAFGWNDSLTILDVNLMLDIDRFRKVNVGARSGDQVFDQAELAPRGNLDFIRRCVDTISDIRFADKWSTEPYAWIRDGRLVWCDVPYIEAQAGGTAVKSVLQALGYTGEAIVNDVAGIAATEEPASIDEAAEHRVTIGHWGRDDVVER